MESYWWKILIYRWSLGLILFEIGYILNDVVYFKKEKGVLIEYKFEYEWKLIIYKIVISLGMGKIYVEDKWN